MNIEQFLMGMAAVVAVAYGLPYLAQVGGW